MKTCLILPSLLKKAFLIISMYKEKIDKEHEFDPLTDSLLVRHDEMDFEILQERKRIRKINRLFIVFDIIVVIALFITQYYILVKFSSGRDVMWNNFIKDFGIQGIFTMLISYSACYITNFVKTKSNQKPNTCLLSWHIINLSLVMISAVLSLIIEQRKYQLAEK